MHSCRSLISGGTKIDFVSVESTKAILSHRIELSAFYSNNFDCVVEIFLDNLGKICQNLSKSQGSQ